MLSYLHHSHCFDDGVHLTQCLASRFREPSFPQTGLVPTLCLCFLCQEFFSILILCPVNAYPFFKMGLNSQTCSNSQMFYEGLIFIVIPLCISFISGPTYPVQCFPHSNVLYAFDGKLLLSKNFMQSWEKLQISMNPYYKDYLVNPR